MRKLRPWLICALFVAACGGDDAADGETADDMTTDDGTDTGDLFPDKPECDGDQIVAFAGAQPQIMSSLALAQRNEGYDLDGPRDLDGDMMVDNKLGGLADVANGPLEDALNEYDLLIAMEMFDYDGGDADTCVKFALYLGSYKQDLDGDGADTTLQGGDCDDTDAAVKPGAAEVAGNFKDDNCNGLADETSPTVPSTDPMDRDGDLVSVMDGDCDDTDMTVHEGAVEICGDGLDNDCDGQGDRTGGATATACSPFSAAAPVTMPIDPLSFDGAGKPLISFDDGTISTETGVRTLHAGPSLFAVTLPITDGVALDLRISGATIDAKITETGGRLSVTEGILGGVLDAKTADTIRGLDIPIAGITPENSLLDGAFAGALGDLIALPESRRMEVTSKYPNCRTPDVDVDGDGYEAFCETNPAADPRVVDACIDGDGTEVLDLKDGAGVVTMHCALAKDDAGKDRFVDGISVALKFATTPLQAIEQQ
jgi:hypothetical protein